MATLDAAAKMKVLPKVRGDGRIAEVLDKLEAFLDEAFGGTSQCSRAVKRMKKELAEQGSTRYWR